MTVTKQIRKGGGINNRKTQDKLTNIGIPFLESLRNPIRIVDRLCLFAMLLDFQLPLTNCFRSLGQQRKLRRPRADFIQV